MQKLNALALAGIAGIAAPFVTPVAAQDAAPEQTVPGANEVSEEEIDAFAEAYGQIIAIDKKFGAEMEQTEDEAKLDSLREEARTEMAQAVADTPGIDPERYIQILRIAQTDPDLRTQLAERIEG